MSQHISYARNPRESSPVQPTSRRRGTSIVLVAVSLPVFLGFAALTVDSGYLYLVRQELQMSADAAALAGASALISDEMMRVRMGTEDSITMVQHIASIRIDVLAGPNTVLAGPSLQFSASDIATGWLNLDSPTSVVQTGVAPLQNNAVRVLSRRTSDSPNGPVELFFAGVFGQTLSEISASAVAIYDDRVAGFDTEGYPGGILPLTVHEDVYNADFLGGPDNYDYDPATDSILSGSDGIREIRLYPHNSAPGNFGLLNIGMPNMDTEGLRDHIENGVPPEDFEAEVGTSELTFYNDDGDNGGAVTYAISGNPGLKASLESSLQTRLGQVVGFFIHNAVSGTGDNTVYTIKDIRFGRLVEVRLNGGNKAVYLQPTSYSGSGVVTSPNAPSSNGLLGRLYIAR